MTREQLKALPDRPWAKWLRLLTALFMLPLIAWGIQVEIRLSVIEANRWTAGDEARWQSAHNEMHSDLLRMLERKADRSDVPPREVREALAEIRTDVRENRKLIMEILQEVNGR